MKTQKTSHIPSEGVLPMNHGGSLQIMREMCLILWFYFEIASMSFLKYYCFQYL